MGELKVFRNLTPINVTGYAANDCSEADRARAIDTFLKTYDLYCTNQSDGGSGKAPASSKLALVVCEEKPLDRLAGSSAAETFLSEEDEMNAAVDAFLAAMNS